MENKNSKSDSYIIREAENIINNYLKDREMSDIQNYYHLKEKYERLKILSIAIFITSSLGLLITKIIF